DVLGRRARGLEGGLLSIGGAAGQEEPEEADRTDQAGATHASAPLGLGGRTEAVHQLASSAASVDPDSVSSEWSSSWWWNSRSPRRAPKIPRPMVNTAATLRR